ncbi:ketose-bisphosphate aldolase class-II family protein [Tanacetum coccineum]
MVNQLLAGVHIASAAEAMAFGARLGLDIRILFDIIKSSEGTSWYGHLSWFSICSASGWGRLDDSAVVKVYETLTGIKVEGKLSVINKKTALESLPSEWALDPLDEIRRLDSTLKTLVVLDDDPTRTQTVHDVDVLTEWNVESLVEQLKSRPKCFFNLTNS